jgi:hypothetical protein
MSVGFRFGVESLAYTIAVSQTSLFKNCFWGYNIYTCGYFQDFNEDHDIREDNLTLYEMPCMPGLDTIKASH